MQNVNKEIYITPNTVCLVTSHILFKEEGRGGHRSFFFGVFSLFFDGQDGSIQNYYMFSNA